VSQRPTLPRPARRVHPIEAESYRILRSTVDLSGLPPHTRDVAERIVHTTADLSWIDDLTTDEDALATGAAALAAGAPLILDAGMVAAGITTYASVCLIGSPAAAELAARAGITRSAAGFRLAAAAAQAGSASRGPVSDGLVSDGLVSDGAVWAVGNAPTALVELLRLAEAGVVRPALVIGLPVGFVGAAEAKAALRATGLPALSNVSAKGGSAVAAAAVNALLYGDPLA
jgi:precorrin-8X/cobalt-precorrin-8 methylmutase